MMQICEAFSPFDMWKPFHPYLNRAEPNMIANQLHNRGEITSITDTCLMGIFDAQYLQVLN
jgi:hypothetical protein